MLKKAERLSRTAFSEYFKRAKRSNHDHATLHFVPHQSFHASVVVSKKVSKRAVKRNTYRRLVYGQLYTLLRQRDKKGVFIVVLKPSFGTLTKQAQQTEIKKYIEGMSIPA